MKRFSLFLFLLTTSFLMAQTPPTYTDTRGNTQLCGPFELATLQTDKNFSGWFQENYEALTGVFGKDTWAKNLQDTKVEIFLGTWCSDSQYLVPRFVKLWDELGLDREQLHFVAVYGSDVEGKYKLSTNGEEEGKYIHRMPTIIISRDKVEIGRIVESPASDLNIDVAKMALGNAPNANFLAATQLMQLLDQQSIEELQKHQSDWIVTLKNMAQSEGDLNSLARVYLLTDRMREALFTLAWNSLLFPTSTKALKTYAKVLASVGQKDKAIAMYKKVIALDNYDDEAFIELQQLQTGR